MKRKIPFIMPILRSVLFIISGLILLLITNQTLTELGRWWPIICIVCNIITIFILVIVCRYEEIKYIDLLNYKKGQSSFKYVFAITIIMLMVGVGSMVSGGIIIYGAMPTSSIQPLPVWVAVINVILLPLTIVFAEIPLYFGYSFKRIEEQSKNKLFAAIYVIFFYALQHSFIPLLWDWKHILFRFISFIPLLIVLSIIYIRRRNLIPLMIGHGVMDLATGIQILISSIFPAVFEMMNK